MPGVFRPVPRRAPRRSGHRFLLEPPARSGPCSNRRSPESLSPGVLTSPLLGLGAGRSATIIPPARPGAGNRRSSCALSGIETRKAFPSRVAPSRSGASSGPLQELLRERARFDHALIGIVIFEAAESSERHDSLFFQPAQCRLPARRVEVVEDDVG